MLGRGMVYMYAIALSLFTKFVSLELLQGTVACLIWYPCSLIFGGVGLRWFAANSAMIFSNRKDSIW
jgi:hypothetical protein